MSNKIPCGGFYLDDMLSVNDSGELSINGGTPYQQLVTDGDGNTKWEDRLAYESSRIVVDTVVGTFVTPYALVTDEFPDEEVYENHMFTFILNNGIFHNVPMIKISDTLFEGGPVIFCLTDNIEYKGGVFPRRGVYFSFSKDGSVYVKKCIVGSFSIPETAWDGNIDAIKTIDPKYIKDMYYDNKTVFVEQTKITNAGKESTIELSLLVNGTPVTVNIDGTEYNATLEEGGEYILGTGASNCYYHIGNSGGINISSKTTFTSGYPFFVVIDEDGACMVLFDGESVGTEHTFGVYTGEIKQIDPKYIPNPNVIVNITHNKDDGTLTADKTFSEVKALIDSGANVKCMYNSAIFNWMGFNDEEKSSMLFEADSFVKGVALFILFALDSISVDFIFFKEMLLPEVFTSDNSKFLSVVNGTWQASSNLIIPSSTSGSSKKFKITVDDSGTISATQVT